MLFKSTEISFVSSGYPFLILIMFSALAFQQYKAITVVVGVAMYVETLKYLMGHTDISVTSNMYTHLKLEDAQREMERLERIEKEMKKCAK